MKDQGGIWWQTVLVEAAFCFSLPTWMLTTSNAWPVANNALFLLLLAVSATVAALLFHVVPASYGRWSSSSRCSAYWPLIERASLFLLALGAGVSLYRLTYYLSGLVIAGFSFNRTSINTAAIEILIVLVIAFLVLASRKIQNSTAVVTLTFSVLLLGVSTYLQRTGIATKNIHLADEPGLNHPSLFFFNFVAALSPISIMPWRMGRESATARQIWTSALLGVWMPVALSVALAAYSRVAGVRLYWHPSVPIGIEFAFAWMPRSYGTISPLQVALAPTFLIPIVVCGMWINEGLHGRPRKTRRIGALLIVVVAVLCGETSLQNLPERMYFAAWCWGVLIAMLVVALYQSFRWFKARRSLRPADR